MTEEGETPWIQCANCHSTATPAERTDASPRARNASTIGPSRVSSHLLSRAVLDAYHGHAQVAPSLPWLESLLRYVSPVDDSIVHAGMACTPPLHTAGRSMVVGLREHVGLQAAAWSAGGRSTTSTRR